MFTVPLSARVEIGPERKSIFSGREESKLELDLFARKQPCDLVSLFLRLHRRIVERRVPADDVGLRPPTVARRVTSPARRDAPPVGEKETRSAP